MIVYVFSTERPQAAVLAQSISRLREREPAARVAVFASAEHPLPDRPDCDLFRTRPSDGRDAWSRELSLLATVERAFPTARWIGRAEKPGGLPQLPGNRPHLDGWIGDAGYFIRRSFVPRLESSNRPGRGTPIKDAIGNVIAQAGGRVARKESRPNDEGYVTQPTLTGGLPMRAMAFCTVATKEMLSEVKILVQTLRRHHQEPLVLVCDKDVERAINRLKLDGIEIEPITPELQDYSKKISQNVIRHDPYWKPEAIALKFHALRTAIGRHGPAHLLDADITVNASLHTGGPWMADLVLSPFYWPDPHAAVPQAHGFFNAGYLLARTEAVVNRWEQLYKQGVGGFYEQKCLENLGREFVTDWFGPDHNFAKWRWESPDRRPVVSFHHKLKAKGKAKRITDLSRAVRTAVKRTKGARQKIAHIHCVRSWGTYLRCLFRDHLCSALGLQNLVSWDLGLDREWTEAELLLLAEGKLLGQHPGGCGFVHNHTFGWSEKALDTFHKNDWLTVALVRDPREVLVSLAAWSLDVMREGKPCPVWHREDIDNSALAGAGSLEEAVGVLLRDPVYHPQWVLPPWLGKVQWIRRTGSDAIKELTRGACGFTGKLPKTKNRNGSTSRGWEKARLSDDLRAEIEDHPEVKAWDTFFSSIPGSTTTKNA